ncbi:hydrolethalus syndrome protein 1 homolog [Cephus cinctus]|uniref:Hydrolethalus syndrome protein 1 homolog n=1 Tax=Cephus cinctus TaxID=211228 RepID=A0AAJ7BXC4_CEPCN|nr:hydrolethalus syndrome protein 1 homolog [Cephus cinctus]
MTEIRDDPREVLSLLNSLGFVGITAPQLKAFMKDLKLYRKIKERERQQWKEETKRKILSKQQKLYREILDKEAREAGYAFGESILQPSKSSACQDTAKIKIKVRCEPEEKELHKTVERTQKCTLGESHEPHIKEDTHTKEAVVPDSANTSPQWLEKSKQRAERSRSRCKSHLKNLPSDNVQWTSSDLYKQRNARHANDAKESGKEEIHKRPASAPELSKQPKHLRSRSAVSDSAAVTHLPSIRPPSKNSSRTQHKSFIRPWRLQPDSQKSTIRAHSDPVSLYQKYQHEWKQLALPGEEHHSAVRWAVREKMLGSDPNPRPVLRKSSGSLTSRKR